MSARDRDDKRKRDKSLTAFWRACSHLKPYWRTVAISIGCAVFVGLATAGGIATMLPIIRIVLNGDTLATWADRQAVAHRLHVTFADQSAEPDDQLPVLRLAKVDASSNPKE